MESLYKSIVRKNGLLRHNYINFADIVKKQYFFGAHSLFLYNQVERNTDSLMN